MTQTRAKLQLLLEKHPAPNNGVADRRTKRLYKMSDFYTKRAEQVDGEQIYVFKGFAKAAIWAVYIAKQYRSLIKELAEITEADDETGTDR